MYKDILRVSGEVNNPNIVFIEVVNNINSCFLNKLNDNFNSFMIDVLDEYGVNQNSCMFVSLLRDFKISEENNDIHNSIDIRDIVFSYLKNFSNIPVIATIGGSASEEFLNEDTEQGDFTQKFSSVTGSHGNIYSRTFPFGSNNYSIIPIFHPTYVLNHSNNTTKQLFKMDLKKCINLSLGLSVGGKEFGDECVQIFNYKQFDNFLKDEIDNCDTISYDVESNAKLVTSKDYKIVGFSLASRREKSCYVVLESLDFKMNEEDKRMIEARLRKVFLTRKIIYVYNCMHELPATLNWLGIEIIEQLHDVFIKVKLINNKPDKYEGNGGLKIQCQMNLGVSDWSEDLDLYFGYIKQWVKEKNMPYALRGIISKYYQDSEEVTKIINKLEYIYENDKSQFTREVISYGLVPCNLISKYGGTDSAVLFDLNDFYERKFNEYNKKFNIDLSIGYEHWRKHHIAGYTLERNGAFWNDNVASDVERWCTGIMYDSMRTLIKHPLSSKYLKEKLEWDFIVFLKDHKLTRILPTKDCLPKRNNKRSMNIQLTDSCIREGVNNDFLSLLKRMSLVPNKKYQVKLELGNIKTIVLYYLGEENYNIMYESWYNNFMNDYFSEDNRSIADMTNLLNPASTLKAFRDFVSSILITPELRYAKAFEDLSELISRPEFNIDYYKGNDRELFELFIKFKEMDESNTTKFRLFNKFLSLKSDFYSYKITNVFNNALTFVLEHMDDDAIIGLYNLFCIIGVDIEDETTWTEEFKWMHSFRLYKKAKKIISVYIDGNKVGRNNVFWVDKESLENGDPLTKRECNYYEMSPEEAKKKGKVPILQSSFFVDFASTGRWKCLDGETIIPLLDGRNVKIKDLVNEKDFYVYSYDFNKGHIMPGLCKGCKITGQNTPMIEIELDNGEKFRCTPEHKIMKRNGHYIKAQDIKVGQSLMPYEKDNIKIVSVKRVENSEFVYDLNVEKYHNFAIGSGIIVHNSGMHTFPSGDTIKNIFTSRFKNGIISMPDLSQAEIRTLAAMSKDENLMNAFLSGNADIHRFVASKIWQIEPEEVTKNQRSIAKGAVFGILYGESEKSFAESFTKGNMEEADKIFNYFYSAFPKIKGYVEWARGWNDRCGSVPLPITNRFIDIPEDPWDKDKSGRQSQNWVIQGTMCLRGSTKIKMLDGTSKTIEELTNSDEDKFYLYSYDEKRNKIVPSVGIFPRVTNNVNKLIRITFDNGESVECTDNHKFMCRNGKYVEASDLNIGDSIMPMYTRLSDKSNNDYIDGYEIIIQNDGSEDYTHRIVCDEFGINVKKGNVRHHKDFNKRNNRPDNIDVSMTYIEHFLFHSSHMSEFLKYKYENDPEFKKRIIECLERGRETQRINGKTKKQLESASKMNKGWTEDKQKFENWYKSIHEKLFNNDERYNEWRCLISETIRNNSELMKFLSESMTFKNINRKKLYPEWYNNQRKASSEIMRRYHENMTHDDYSNNSKKGWENSNHDERIRILKESHNNEETKRRHSEASKIRESNSVYNFNRIKKQLGIMYELNLDWKDPSVWDNSKELVINNGLNKNCFRYFKTIIEKIGYEKFVTLGEEFLLTYNHKIVSIERIELSESENVYDITVPEYGNFVIDLGDGSGVVCHNCDLAGLILYKVCDFIRSNNYKSKVFCFIHDSIEIDLDPHESFEILDNLDYLFNKYPMEDFGVPMGTDIPISCSMGVELEIKSMKFENNYKNAEFVIEGNKDSMDLLTNTWIDAYKSVEYRDTEVKEKYNPLSGLYAKKMTFSKSIGKKVEECTREFKIIRN